MGLFSFLQRKKTPVPETRKRTPPLQDPASVEALRTRARRRLIGSAVLVAGAVVGLPTLFDQPPRPVEQSFKVRMAAADGPAVVAAEPPAPAASSGLVRQGTVALAAPSAGASSVAASSVSSAGAPGVAVAAAAVGTAAAVGLLPGTGKKPQVEDTIITETKADLEADRLRAEKAQAAKAQAERAKAEKLKAEKAEKAREAREAEQQARAAEKARLERLEKAREAREAAARKAQAAKEAREAQAAKEAAARKAQAAREAREAKEAKAGADADKSRRYVIQAGSFADASAARDLRQRIDKLGLKAQEQRVETASGATRTRVRLGPFGSKEEAMRAAARLKAAGLNAAVLPL